MAARRLNPGIVIPLGAFTMVVLIVLISSGALAELARVLEILAAVGGLTLGGRYLLGYRHSLRMEELETRRDIVRVETDRLTAAERILDLDERIDRLDSPRETPPQEA